MTKKNETYCENCRANALWSEFETYWQCQACKRIVWKQTIEEFQARIKIMKERLDDIKEKLKDN